MGYDRGRYQHKWRIERQARLVREQLELDQYAVLDPWRLADQIPAHIFYPEDLVESQLASKLRRVKWDGFSFCPPEERHLMIVLNSSRPQTRQCATIMEEISHHLLRHEPARISRNEETGLLQRSYNKAQEHEAYDLGATILLPKELIQQEVKAGSSVEELARERGCSPAIVKYRIQRSRLWPRYQTVQAAREADQFGQSSRRKG